MVLEGADAATVMARLQMLYDACEQAGVPVVALTNLDADLRHHGMVPADEVSAREATIAEVAKRVAESCRRGQCTVHGVPTRVVADARYAMPLCAEHYDDSLHLTPAGSDRLAAVVHETMRLCGL